MRLVLAILVALSIGSARETEASTYTYHYQGYKLLQSELADCWSSYCPDTWPAFSGIMTINETLVPGGTLANAQVSWGTPGCASDCWNDSPDFLLALTIDWYPPTAFGYYWFQTDSEKNIISWYFDFAHGPPDTLISSVRDYYSGGGNFLTAPPGVWALGEEPVLPADPRFPAPVPLPAPALLLLTACGALLRFRRSRV